MPRKQMICMTYTQAFLAVYFQRRSRTQSCQKKIYTTVAVLAAAGKNLVAAESCAAVVVTMYVQDSALRWNG